MTKLTELYIRLTEILKIQLYLKKENDKVSRLIQKEKLKKKNIGGQMTRETWDAFLKVMNNDRNTTVLDLTKEKKDTTKREHKNIEDVLKDVNDIEHFAAKIADKEDNPSITYRDADRIEEANKIPLTDSQKKLVDHIQQGQDSAKRFGRGGFGEGKPDDAMYLKELQKNRILKKLDLIKDKLGDMKQIIMLLEEQLDKLK